MLELSIGFGIGVIFTAYAIIRPIGIKLYMECLKYKSCKCGCKKGC